MDSTESNWLKQVANYANEHGCYPFRKVMPFHIHHVLGRTARQNKVPIGHWFILPIAIPYHDVNSNNPHNVTHYPKQFTKRFGKQRDLFFEMLDAMALYSEPLNVPDNVLRTILDMDI